MKKEGRISISNVGFREGQLALHPVYQDRGVIFSRRTILDLTELNVKMGTDVIELGSPVRSPFARETIQQVVRLVDRPTSTTEFALHYRCTDVDVNAALDALPEQSERRRRFHLYYGTYPELRRGNGNKTNVQLIEAIVTQSIKIRQIFPNAYIRFSTENAYLTPIDDLVEILQGINKHPGPIINAIGFPDTTGFATPEMVQQRLRILEPYIPRDTDVYVHNHRDRGTAAYNYLIAWQTLPHNLVLDFSPLTLGERNGIPSLEEIIAAFGPENTQLFTSSYDLQLLRAINFVTAEYLHMLAPQTLPLSNLGYVSNVSGVHATTALRSQRAYHQFPNIFEIEPYEVIASAVVGKSTIQSYCENVLQLTINDLLAQEIANNIRETARAQGNMSPEQAHEIILQRTGANP